MLAELGLQGPAADSALAAAITTRHGRDNRVIDIVYNPNRATVDTLVSSADEAGWTATGPELAPLCEATECSGCDEHWRTTIYGSQTLLGHDEVHAELAAIFTACGLTLTR